MAKISYDAPKWFAQFAKDAGFEPHDPDLGLDHPRHFKEIALFAPFEVKGKDFSTLLGACANRGLVVDLRGASFYSDATFRIAVYRPEDLSQFLNCYTEESGEIARRKKYGYECSG